MIDVKKFTMAVVSLAVAILLVLTVLVPVINDSVGSGSGSGYTNTGDFQYKTIKSDSEEHTVTVTLDNDSVTVTTDGVMAYQSSVNDVTCVPIIYGHSFVAYITQGDTPSEILCMYVGTNIETDYSSGQGMNNTANTVEYTITGHTTYDGEYNIIGMIYGNITEDDGYTVGYIVADGGDAVLSEKPVVADDTEIVGMYYDSSDWTYSNVWGYGTANDLQVSPAHEGEVTFDITTTDMNGLIKIENLKADWSWEDTSPYRTIDHFFVPIQIGSGSGGISPTLASMLSVIPLVVVVGLILGAITMFIKKD